MGWDILPGLLIDCWDSYFSYEIFVSLTDPILNQAALLFAGDKLIVGAANYTSIRELIVYVTHTCYIIGLTSVYVGILVAY